jgi:Flp pilus assembly protein TadG
VSRRAARGEAGQALVLAVVMMPFFLSIIGVAIDGAVVFGARRDLQSVADAAARAAAMQVDTREYRASGGGKLVLDREGARRVAAEYLVAQRQGLTGEVGVDDGRVVVKVNRDVPTAFLRIVGLNAVRISTVAEAQAWFGIDRPSR